MTDTPRNTELGRALTKGVLGSIPYLGPLVAEVVGVLIPDQRLERIESLLRSLAEKCSGLDERILAERLRTTESIDLLEDAFLGAARALSRDRIEYLASLLKNSLSSTEVDHLQTKRLMSILSELNDAEVIILKSHTLPLTQINDFVARHEAILTPPRPYIGAPQDELDRDAVYSSYKQHLMRLGLLEPRFRSWRKGQLPQFDEKTGTMKITGYRVTSLGTLLLRQIGWSETGPA